jgi:hypothetical protein
MMQQTSLDSWAALKKERKLTPQEDRIVQVLRRFGVANDRTIAEVSGLEHKTSTARRRGLVVKEVVADSGVREWDAGTRREVILWRLNDG